MVSSLTESLSHQNIHVTFDNFIASYTLMEQLYCRGIYATATRFSLVQNESAMSADEVDAGNASSSMSSASECSGDDVDTDVKNSDDVEPDSD